MQAGMLRALCERGIVSDLLVGTWRARSTRCSSLLVRKRLKRQTTLRA
jgi:hypothetical protein